MEDREIKQCGSEFGSNRFLLGINSCISSETTTTNPTKKPRGWKAMPYILGIYIYYFSILYNSCFSHIFIIYIFSNTDPLV